MKKKFLIGGILIFIYLIRLIQYPSGDNDLKNISEQSNVDKIFKILISDEPNNKNDFVTIKGKIIERCDKDNINCQKIDSKSFVNLRIHNQALTASLEKNKLDDLEIGDYLFVNGTLMSIVVDDKGYENYLRKEKIFYEIQGAKIVSIQKSSNFNLRKFLVRIRKSVEQSIKDNMQRPASDLAQGLVISGKGSMTEELLNDFTRVGLIHIVVLSGSNVSIISGALFAMLNRFHFALRISLGIFFMSAFALMTGAMPPVVRSVLMSSLPLLSEMYERFTSPKDISEQQEDNRSSQRSSVLLLLLTGILIAIYNPLLPLFDVSFQLSFMATLGLMTLTEPISRFLNFVPEKLSLREIVSSTLATQVFVTPLILTIHDQVSTVFLIANILVLPILPIVMFLIGAVSFSSFIFPAITGPISAVSSLLLSGIINIAETLSSLEFATLTLGMVTNNQALVIYILLIISVFFIHLRKKKVT